MGSVDTLLAHKGGRLKKGDNFPDQNVVDLIVALAKTYGLKVDCSQMHEPVPIASDVTTAGGRTIVRGHKTRALFVQNLIRCRRLRRSEEHTSELQSLMRNSYAVFCLNKNTTPINN